MLEFKPFDIDDKTHGYRAEENGENIGECIFSLGGTYAEILNVKTRDGDRRRIPSEVGRKLPEQI
mgnify:CR=1 FL=1